MHYIHMNTYTHYIFFCFRTCWSRLCLPRGTSRRNHQRTCVFNLTKINLYSVGSFHILSQVSHTYNSPNMLLVAQHKFSQPYMRKAEEARTTVWNILLVLFLGGASPNTNLKRLVCICAFVAGPYQKADTIIYAA